MEQGTSADDGTSSASPAKLCGCGCGEPAPIATKNRPEHGHVKGQPMRFLVGHNGRKVIRPQLRPGQVAQFVRLCGCGCGHPTPIAARSLTSASAVKGQPLEFIGGHRTPVKGPPGCKRKLFVGTGQRFGAAVVVDPETVYVASSGKTYRGARLLCDCGAEFVRPIERVLRRPGIQSCGGCAGSDDHMGRRFGRLTVVRWIPNGTVARGGRWLCRCDCGNEVTHLPNELGNGRAKSCGCGRRGPRNGPAFRTALNRYQANAQDRGLPWNLTDDDFLRLAALDCHYCGAAPANATGTFIHNGLDRVDNKLGYTPNNVVPACKVCNHAKVDMSYDDFLAWIARLASFHFFRPDMTPAGLLKPPA